jgi:DNA anti-recombination protein RmuC
MFVPSETALAAVTSYDKTLWQTIFTEYGVCLASERNLLVLIEMIRYMWQRQVTISNYENIINKATDVLDRVTDFMSHFSSIEKALKAATQAADKMRKLSAEGGSSIATAVRNLSSLGVKPRKVQKNDRPKLLNEFLNTIAQDDTIEQVTPIEEQAEE